MSDSLVIGGVTFNNVAGFKATDNNSSVQTYIKPEGTKTISIISNGTTTEDVTTYTNAEITVNVVPSTVSAVTGSFTLASAASVPTGGYTLPIQLSFQPDFFQVWMDPASFNSTSSPSNNHGFVITFLKVSKFTPIYISSTVGSESRQSANGYLAYRGTAVATTSGNTSGYGVNGPWNVVNQSTYPLWEVNSNGTITVARFSSSSWSFYAGTYKYIAGKFS